MKSIIISDDGKMKNRISFCYNFARQRGILGNAYLLLLRYLASYWLAWHFDFLVTSYCWQIQKAIRSNCQPSLCVIHLINHLSSVLGLGFCFCFFDHMIRFSQGF
jgi:hypothetical protein